MRALFIVFMMLMLACMAQAEAFNVPTVGPKEVSVTSIEPVVRIASTDATTNAIGVRVEAVRGTGVTTCELRWSIRSMAPNGRTYMNSKALAPCGTERSPHEQFCGVAEKLMPNTSYFLCAVLVRNGTEYVSREVEVKLRPSQEGLRIKYFEKREITENSIRVRTGAEFIGEYPGGGGIGPFICEFDLVEAGAEPHCAATGNLAPCEPSDGPRMVACFEGVLNGLKPGTTYRVVAKVRDTTNGTIATSIVRQYETKIAAPPVPQPWSSTFGPPDFSTVEDKDGIDWLITKEYNTMSELREAMATSRSNPLGRERVYRLWNRLTLLRNAITELMQPGPNSKPLSSEIVYRWYKVYSMRSQFDQSYQDWTRSSTMPPGIYR